MMLNDQYLRMADLANQPERPARNYTAESGQQRIVTARPASRGITGFSAKHLYFLINNGQFPAPIKIGRASLWRLSDINAWIEKHSASSNDGER